MLSKLILIRNSIGLHARPVFQLATAALDYQSDIQIRHRGYSANVKNSARVLALGVNNGEVIELTVEGIDEESAYDNILRVFDEINQQ